MSKPIRIHQVIGDNANQRLNAFPGRSLSEHSFDLMQAHVDARIDPLLGNGHPGIVEGLHLTTHKIQKKMQLRVQPGTAVGADGRAIRVFFPIELDWEALISAYRQSNEDPEAQPDGYYFLTVRRMVGRVEDAPYSKPCTRDQLDPVRDSRIETYATLDLQFITDSNSLREMPQRRAVNHLCVRFLHEPAFRIDTGAVPLAIAFIDKGKPKWVDTIGGRFPAQPNAPYHAFAAHWDNVLENIEQTRSLKLSAPRLAPFGDLRTNFRAPSSSTGSGRFTDLLASTREPTLEPFARPFSASLGDSVSSADIRTSISSTTEQKLPSSLRALMGVDYMPAAGRFPDHLIEDIAGMETGETDEDWALPRMLFAAQDLQIELLPVPASTALGVVKRELPRGALDLINGQGDRMRLMVAVEDRDYRPNLMDLPVVDFDLIDELYYRAQTAAQTEHDWAKVNRELYALLDEDPFEKDEESDDIQLSDTARVQFKSTFLTPAYSNSCELLDDVVAYGDYPNLNLEQRKALNIPAPVCPVISPDDFFEELREAGPIRPYSNTRPEAPEDYEAPVFEETGEPGLYRQSYALAEQIEALEEQLEENHDLIDDINDFLSIQRQHLDSITTNLAAIAGGVAGDGSGLQLMRWNGKLRFEPKE